MSIHWIDGKGNSLFSPHPLSSLISSLLEPADPSPAIRQAFRLAHLLLLSNSINAAHALIGAIYAHAEAISPSTATAPAAPPAPSLALESFWQTHHQTHPRPLHAPVTTHHSLTPEAYLARQQWGKYRECTRTGWMLEHCNLPEPADPQAVWRTTDDPALLGMCARLLAKSTVPGTYPSQERMRDALAAAKKLYALPQVPASEWAGWGAAERGEKRHSYLLYRRLVVELAIRVGDREGAAEVLGMGLRIDGFNVLNGGQVWDYLGVPGIWDVLPLLARGGRESNPFFVGEEEAEVMVREIIRALELRATEGRQWSLAADKVGWTELLDRLARGAWKVNRKEYRRMGVSCAADILYAPATEKEIEAAKKKVGELPEDFTEMIRSANGFKGGWHFLSGGISGIQYISISDEGLDNYAPDFINQGMKQDGSVSGEMIELQAGSDCDAFRHYIIPPAIWKDSVADRNAKDGEYRYWHWAPWQGVTSTWDSVRDWVASCVEEVEEMVERDETVEGDGDGEEDSELEQDEDGGSYEKDDVEYDRAIGGEHDDCTNEDAAGNNSD